MIWNGTRNTRDRHPIAILWVQIAILAALYFACGKIGLLLAVPPGYATIIWPPSGIAVGALLLYGRALWPGILIGSSVLNISLGGPFGVDGEIAWSSIAIGCSIAAGSTLQALVARELIARFIGIPLDLKNAVQALLLFVLSGPLSCLIAATIGSLTLYYAGNLEPEAAIANWSTWWFGDLLGVIIFFPLVLFAPVNADRLKWKSSTVSALPVASLLILLLPLGLTFYAWKAASQNIYEKGQVRFTALAEESEAALKFRLDSYHQALLGGLGFFRGSQNVERSEWRDYVDALALEKSFPGINGIGYIAAVADSELAAFVDTARNSSPDFRIHPETENRPNFVIELIEPIEINREAVGLNIGFEDNRVEAASKSRDTGEPAITKRILLVQDDTKSPGFLLLHPYYENGASTETEASRRRALHGWVYAPFVARSFMNALTTSQDTLLNLRVYDGSEANADNLIFASDAGNEASPEDAYNITKHTQVMQQPWTLEWTSTPAFEAASRSNEPILFLVAGLGFTALFGILLQIFARRAETVAQLVEKKTQEIAASEEHLKLLIRHTPAAVAMFDKNMRYIMTSDHWLKEYGLTQEVVGQSHYEVFSDVAELDRWRELHSRALVGETLSNDEESRIGPNGLPEWIKWALHPWLDASGEIGGIVMFTENISAQKQSEFRAKVLRELATEAVDAPSVEHIYASTLQKICKYFPWTVGHVHIWDDEAGELISSNVWHFADGEDRYQGFRQSVSGMQFDSGEGLPGKVMSERRAVFLGGADIARDCPFGQLATEHGLDAAMGVPIFAHNKPVAVLELLSRDRPRPPARAFEFLDLLAGQVSRFVERRRYEEALARSNSLNNAILNSAEYLVVATDLEGKVLVFNNAAERCSGYSADEVVDNETPALWHDPEEVVERAEQLSEELGETVEPGFNVFTRKAELYGSDSGEWTFIRKDGSHFPVHLTVTPLHDEHARTIGFVGILEDITLRKQRDAELQASEETFRSAMEYASSGMALVGLDGKWQKVNAALCSLLAYRDSELEQMGLLDVTHPEDIQEFVSGQIRLLNGDEPSFQLEKRYLRKDDQAVWVLANVSLAYSADGAPKCFIVQVQDITERREMERLKSEFISVVSHELRTPLTSIRGSLGLIAGKMVADLPGPVNKLIGIALKNSERLILLINDILDMDKIAAGNMSFVNKTEDLSDVVSQSIEANRSYADRFGVTFEMSEVEDQVNVHVDSARLTQIFSNLLSNAAKFSPENGTVNIRIERRERSARVYVQDHGKGIPAKFQPRLFGKFAQADSSVTREKGGTGLGLHISKQLTERMGGTIGFDSKEGEGSTFWIELPIAGELPLQSPTIAPETPVHTDTAPAAGTANTTGAANTAGAAGRSRLPQILHVEDEVDLSAMLSAALRGQAELLSAPTLADARRILAHRKIDLLVLDISLPDGNGLSLLDGTAALRDRHIPALILTANEEATGITDRTTLVKSRVSETRIVEAILELIDGKPHQAEEVRNAI